jgi:hypothetical protein
MAIVLVMMLAALFSVLIVAVLVRQRRPGRDRRRRRRRAPLRVGDQAASIPLAGHLHFPLPRRGGPFVSPGFGTSTAPQQQSDDYDSRALICRNLRRSRLQRLWAILDSHSWGD